MKRNWLWLIGPWALFLALAGGWIAYWMIVAGEAERRLDAWMAEQRAGGASAEIGAVERRGFPTLLRLELRDIAYAPARGGWRASTESAELHVNLLNTEHVSVQARSPIAFERADGAVTTLRADALIASLRTAGGALAQAGVEADNLTLDDPAREGVLAARKLVLNVRPDPRTAGDYQVAFDAQALTLPRPVRSFESFGNEVSALRAAIVVTQGRALLEGADRDPLGPWRAAGGELRFEALVLNWGPLETTGSGRGGLDTERRLQGELEFPIEEPARVFSAIANDPRVDDDARQALSLLATAFQISGDDITLDVEARDGLLRLEGVRVRTLGPVY
ncbi:MAG: DUF2125 domain-containing protein [Hyphomonadaceae bacterium]|nr:DUF2125 domain-containing protein [Hyphomonadaceae bacterium]